MCAKMSTPADHPFCSDRCAKVDLNRWLSGGYGIPVVEFDDLSEGDDQS
ncbi:DNA gyrase inhibitor YacG [Pannonibacter carbonis]